MSTDKETVDAYNDYAGRWGARMRSGMNKWHRYLEKPAMYERLPDLTGRSVLAVGCGTGEECMHMRALGADRVVGIDISEGLIEYARKNSPADIEFRVMDMENIELDETFDFVYSSLALHYTDSWERALKSISAVMKDGATFLLSTCHPVNYGAEMTRTDDEYRVLLGYREMKDGGYEVTGDYLNSRKIKDVWFGDFTVNYYHRPLEEVIGDILRSDFEIIDFAEPKAIPEAKKTERSFYEIHTRIPLFMIFTLRKG